MLKPELFKAWVNILLCSGDDGRLPGASEIAFALRVTPIKAAEYLALLCKHGLVDKRDGAFFMHDWDAHQYASDTDPTARDRKRRQRDKQNNVTRDVTRDADRDGHASVTRTDTDTDTETEQNRAEQSRASRKRKSSAWPADAIVPDEWVNEGREARDRHKLPELNMAITAERFAHYWASNGAAKRDWKRTWLNWCISEKGPTNGTARQYGKSQTDQLRDIARGDDADVEF